MRDTQLPPGNGSSADASVGLSQYPRMFWRRRGVILFSAAIVFCAAVVALIFIPEEFEASTVLSIEDRRLLSREVEQVLGGWSAPSTSYKRDEERMAKINGRIRSRPFLEQVARTLKVIDDPKLRQGALKARESTPELPVEDAIMSQVVNSIGSRIRLKTTGSGLYVITVRDYSPRNAQLLAQWISELYIDVTLQKEMEQIRAVRAFGSDQLRIYEQQLRNSEEALRRYQGSLIGQRLSTGAVDGSNLTAAEAAYRRVSDESTLANTRARVAAREATQAGLTAEDSRVTTNPNVRATAEQLVSALDRISLSASPGADPTAATTARNAVASTRAELYRGVEQEVRKLYGDRPPEVQRVLSAALFARLDADAQTEVVGRLRSAIENYKRQAQTAPGSELTVQRLQDEVDKNRQLLESFRAQMTSSDISQAAESTKLGLRMEILDPAQLPTYPVAPERNKILLMALLIGPLLGIGVALLMELTDPTLRSLDDIRRVAPEVILGTIPLIDAKPSEQAGWFRRNWLPVAVTSLLLVTVTLYKSRAVLFPNTAPGALALQMTPPDEELPR